MSNEATKLGTLDPALFVTETIHEREITLGDLTKHTLYFKEIASADFAVLQGTGTSDKDRFNAVSRVIAQSLCAADGTVAVTPQQASKLKHGVRMALALAIAEVNGVGALVGKLLPPEASDGSGTSVSSPELVEEQSAKQSET